VRRLLLVTLLALGSAAPAHAASFQVGAGTNPGIALDESGGAVLGWQTGSDYNVEVCVLPPRARACTAKTAVAFPGFGFARSRVSVLRLAPNVVDVVVPRDLRPDYHTFLARSIDGGRTFGPAVKISDNSFEQAVLTPDGRIALVGGLLLQAGLVRSDGADAATQGSALGEVLDGFSNDIAPLGGGLLAVGSAAGRTQAYQLPAGGDPNAPGSWQRLPDLPLGRQPELTVGPAGLAALLEPISPVGAPRGLFLQRLVGANWTAPVTINSDRDVNNDFDLAQSASGRLTALWTKGSPYRLHYTTSIDGGVLWSSHATVALFPDQTSGLEMATAANGAGIAVIGTALGDAKPIRVARFSPRTAPLAQRRFGSTTVQARAVCSNIGHFGVVVEAARDGARVSPGTVLRGASFGRVRGARRTFAQRFRAGYDPRRTSLRIPVRMRPRSGRSRTLTLRARRCNVPG
jgi:hypothetical protein